MFRRLALLLTLLCLAAGAACAQPKPAPAPAGKPAITAEQAQAALDVLTDDAKRRDLVNTLQTIAHAQAAAAPAQPPGKTDAAPAPATAPAHAASTAPAAPSPAPALPQLLPGSLGEELLTGASANLTELGSTVATTARTVLDLPILSLWFFHVVEDPGTRGLLLDAAWRVGLVLLAALLADYAARRLLARPVRAIARHAPEGGERLWRLNPSAATLLRRLPLALACFGLEVLPVLAAAAIGYLLAGTPLVSHPVTRSVVIAVLTAYIVVRAVSVVTRLLVSPGEPHLRLVGLSEGGAIFALRWVQRIAVVAVFGYTFVQVGLLFGLYLIAHDALLRLMALVLHVMVAVMIFQMRGPVARRIRARPGATGPFAAFRNRAAATWHWVAIFYVMALWFVWAFEITNGISRLIRGFIVTVVIAAVARLLFIAIAGAVEREVAGADFTNRHPALAGRARGYLPTVRFAAGLLIFFAACVAVLEAWGFSSFEWLQSTPLGGRLLSAGLTIAFAVLLALLAWEASNAAIEQHLNRLTREAQLARSARLRTLLPMLRTTLFVVIVLFAGLTILSEIGVNIAPLLAGASVVGLAIGFGSQRLVQDVITGLFLLLENTMQVGDVVSLGGLSGTVEALSIRTIRLRALDGAVHIVPFSAVTTVTNMTRDFSYAVVDVSVGLNEESDHVATVLKDVVAGMRREPDWSSAVRDDLEVLGIDKFVDLAWVMRVRVKTLPSQRWAVTRELNRRIKYRFDELAIESPITSFRVLSSNSPPPQAQPATVSNASPA